MFPYFYYNTILKRKYSEFIALSSLYMVGFVEVIKTFLLPVKFILHWFCVFTLIFFLQLFLFWTDSFIPGKGMLFDFAVSHFVYILFTSFPSSVIGTIVIFILRQKAYTENRLLSFLLLILTTCFIFFFGYINLNRAKKGRYPLITDRRIPFLSRHFHFLDDNLIYIEIVKNSSLRGIVIHERNNPPGLSFRESGEYISESSVLLMQPEGVAVEIPSESLFFPYLFGTEPFLGRFLEDVAFFNTDIQNLYNSSKRKFSLVILAGVLFSVSLRVFMRLTRWPVFNGIVIIFLFRLFFALYKIIQSELIIDISVSIFPVPRAFHLPAFFFFMVSLVFIAWDFLLAPGRSSSRSGRESLKR
ncbi:MAG: hypothetical protein DRP87_02705 [Spirochaetes bacterium]|nr:MAG: hypothetical protein DRP87_02705 [Spirochaetota bacterium]